MQLITVAVRFFFTRKRTRVTRYVGSAVAPFWHSHAESACGTNGIHAVRARRLAAIRRRGAYGTSRGASHLSHPPNEPVRERGRERDKDRERERSMAEKEKEEADEECRKEKAKEEEKEREKSHDDGANWIMSSFGCSPTAGGCCPINTNGDTDIFGRKFSLPVSNEQPRRQHNAHTLLRPETTRGAMHRSTQSTRPRRSISFLSQSRTCMLSTRRGSPSSQGS